MATRNDVTGDEIRTRSSKTYADNWERIFGKKDKENSNEKNEKSTEDKNH